MTTPEIPQETCLDRLKLMATRVLSVVHRQSVAGKVAMGAYVLEYEPGVAYWGFDEVPPLNLRLTDSQREQWLAGLQPAIATIYAQQD